MGRSGEEGGSDGGGREWEEGGRTGEGREGGQGGGGSSGKEGRSVCPRLLLTFLLLFVLQIAGQHARQVFNVNYMHAQHPYMYVITFHVLLCITKGEPPSVQYRLRIK